MLALAVMYLVASINLYRSVPCDLLRWLQMMSDCTPLMVEAAPGRPAWMPWAPISTTRPSEPLFTPTIR